MINQLKELPKTAKKVILKVESATEYQINLDEEVIDIKNFYLTNDSNNPLTTFLHCDTFNIIVNGDYLKVNNDYINQLIVSILKKIEYQHLVVSNIRFINDKMINQMLDQKQLSIVEFKNMLITRPMINRLKFLDTLKVVVGQDIEDVAYQELLERNIDALTIKKIPFNTDVFNSLSLTKSSAAFIKDLMIDRHYDEQELVDFSAFLNTNPKLQNIYIKFELDLYFIKDIISVIHKTKHKALNLIIDDSAEAQNAVEILIQLHNAFGEQNRIIINIHDTLVDLGTYKIYLEALTKLNSLVMPPNLSPLERIFKVYENVLNLGINISIKHLLYHASLKSNGISNISILSNNLLLLRVNDLEYKYNGILISDVINHGVIHSESFLKAPADCDDIDLPILTFLKCPTQNEMRTYLNTTDFSNIMDITNHFYAVFNEEYNFKYLDYNFKDTRLIKDRLEQIYVQNRTNEFDKKHFYNIVCNVRKQEGIDNITIINQIKAFLNN